MEKQIPKLTRVERVMLFNQFTILAKLYPEQKEDYQDRAEVLRKGLVGEYDEKVLGMVYRDELPFEQCKFVWDVLDMFRALGRGYDEVQDKSGIPEDRIRFRGFDGNNDNEYSYVTYLKEEGKRWTESLAKGPTNSHSSTTKATYERMLSRWNALGSEHKWKLSKEDIQQILS